MRLIVIVSCLILVACGKDSDKQPEKYVKSYFCVFKESKFTEGGRWAQSYWAHYYGCAEKKTGEMCDAIISDLQIKKGLVGTETCEGDVEWDSLEEL